MYNQIERELKILISKEQYEKILLSYEFSDSWKQTNVFYDTDDRQIKQKRGGLRIRVLSQVDSQRTCCFLHRLGLGSSAYTGY